MTTSAASDPYTVRAGEAHAPPSTLRGRLRYLGPGLIVTGAVIGSGELVLTTSLGSRVGWALLWWLLLSCWCKSLVQAELGRYTIYSGDTYLRAINWVPGKIGPVSWPMWLGVLAFLPGTMGLGGILGGAGEALTFQLSLFGWEVAPSVTAGIVAVVTSALLSTGSYRWLERVMLPLVVAFTVATLVCVIAMQFTEFRVTPSEIIGGMAPDLTLFATFAVLALSAYGYTGTTSADIAHYTYWCIEKGYPSFVGSERGTPGFVKHFRGWVKVLQTDVWVAVVIVTCATVPYYILGAGVLHKMGLAPEGNQETISTLSNIFTQTLGPWAVWIFAFGAFCILFSTVVSGAGGGGRPIPDYLIEFKLMDRSNVGLRMKILRWYLFFLPLAAYAIYLFIPNFVILIIIGGLTSAIMLPVQCGVTIWLQSNRLDPELRPSAFTRVLLKIVFVFEAVTAVAVLWFVVLRPWVT